MTLNSAQKQALLSDRLNEFDGYTASFEDANDKTSNQLLRSSMEAVKQDPENTALLYETINRLDQFVSDIKPDEQHFYVVFTSQLILDLIERFLPITDHPELISTQVRYIALLANKTGDVNELQNLFVRTNNLVKALQSMQLPESLSSHLDDTLRTLYFNYGIIATRTHKLSNLHTAYDFLRQQQPDLATQFFAEAMKQIQIVDYPDSVKSVIREYYEQT